MLEEIRQYLRAMPFESFEIHCSNGTVWRVEHPENAAIIAHRVVVAHPDGESAITFSALHIVGVSGPQHA